MCYRYLYRAAQVPRKLLAALREGVAYTRLSMSWPLTEAFLLVIAWSHVFLTFHPFPIPSFFFPCISGCDRSYCFQKSMLPICLCQLLEWCVFAAAFTSSHMSIRFFSVRWWRQAFQASIATPPVKSCFATRLYIMLSGVFVLWPVRFLTGAFLLICLRS